jgi:hypothetical protein
VVVIVVVVDVVVDGGLPLVLVPSQGITIIIATTPPSLSLLGI